MKKNCWEIKNCGRQPGGDKAEELGVCPAASEGKLDGINDGENGGRACWVVAGTLCSGKKQGTYAKKIGNCLECEHYMNVIEEEGINLTPTSEVVDIIN